MDTGYLAALATLACWTASTFVLAGLSRAVQPAVLNKAALLLGFILLGAVVCVVDGISPAQLFTRPLPSNWLWLGLSGILGKSIGDWCGFYALRILGPRRRSMMTTLGPGFAWISGFLILGERLNGLGVAAMLFTILSLTLLIADSAERAEVRDEGFGQPTKGYVAAVAGTALTGIAFILSKKSVLETGRILSDFHATWIRIAVAFATLMLFDAVGGKRGRFIAPFFQRARNAALLFGGVVLGAVLGLSFSLAAVTRLNTTVAFTIFSLLPVTVLIVSAVVYRKRVTGRSVLYALLAVGGVLALVWRDALLEWWATW